AARVAFDREARGGLGLGRRDESRLLVRDPATLSPPAARVNSSPPGHAQGYQDAFNAFVADSYAAARGAEPDGLPVFADGARSARVVAGGFAWAGVVGRVYGSAHVRARW